MKADLTGDREVLQAALEWAQEHVNSSDPIWVRYRAWQLRDAYKNLLAGMDVLTTHARPARLSVVRDKARKEEGSLEEDQHSENTSRPTGVVHLQETSRFCPDEPAQEDPMLPT